ncbi:cobyrinate a,c-diamide synthase [Terrabacter aeriphilus]|uniref:Hydrogenobyrinate a,c-diamide synthase n=1 Tax=Terrabacter aeriphilus TaxID=515662 RepID=A0ABP9JLX1_9MICO
MTALPRLVVAAPGSGHGKTTVATGLMAALRARGLAVAGAKVGPDYIDPGYHSLATGRPGRNLDPFLCGADRVVPLLLHGAAAHGHTDVTVVEGVMGLFDGRVGGDGDASTAHVATLTRSPVVLTVDVSHTTRTAAAIVHGLATFEPGVRVAGVVLNKAASPRHTREVRSALEATGVPVLGVLPRDAGIETPSRHLGLVPAAEREEAAATLERLAARVTEHVDLDAVLAIARTAPDLPGVAWDPVLALEGVPGLPATPGPRVGAPVVAVAGGRAFTFRYAETDELLRAAGLEPVVVDPVRDRALPEGTAGLYLGGGFPEVHAADLAANEPLRRDVLRAVRGGLPTVAECAGLLYLAEAVDGHPMVGAVPAAARMGPRLTLGYRTAVAPVDSLLAPAGSRVTGHEFHRTTVDAPVPGSPGSPGSPAWLLDGRPDGFALDPAGTGRATLHASYLHTHWAGHPWLAARFASDVHAYAGTSPARRRAS